ncbi:TrkA family potassium uptake protein [bacterium]|nr:TrkA family potassium uptake protein [bacterium]
MAQQILVIGLGQFGMALAKTLSEKGVEVLAVDKNIALVEEAASFVPDAMQIDVTDEMDIARLEPAKRDATVCAIGESSREDSIICTALLSQLGAPFIVARAMDPVHKRILKAIGAHAIVTPEIEFGRRFATRLMNRNVVVDTDLGDDFLLTEIRVQPGMVGKNLIELELPKKFGIMVAGIRGKEDISKIMRPDPTLPLRADDRLIIVSNELAIVELSKNFK